MPTSSGYGDQVVSLSGPVPEWAALSHPGPAGRSTQGIHSDRRQLIPRSCLLGQRRGAIGASSPLLHVRSRMTLVILPSSGHAAWDELAAWWLSRYKHSTQQTYATYLPRWSRWCADRRIDPLAARRADVELWLRAVADSGLSRASVAAHYDAVASLYRLAYEEELVAANPCARVTRPKIQRELQRREVLTVLEYAAFLTTACRWVRATTPSPCSAA